MSQKWNSWPFAGGSVTKVKKVVKVVILLSRARVTTRKDGIGLSPPHSPPSADKSHLDPALSDRFPFLTRKSRGFPLTFLEEP